MSVGTAGRVNSKMGKIEEIEGYPAIRRRRRSWASSSSASGSLLGVHIDDEDDAETLRRIDQLLLTSSPRSSRLPVNENRNLFNIDTSAGREFGFENDNNKDAVLEQQTTPTSEIRRVVGTPDSVQRALHLGKQLFQPMSPGLDDSDEEEASDEHEHEHALPDKLANGGNATNGIGLGSQSQSETSTQSSTFPQKAKQVGLTLGNSVLGGITTMHKREIMLWILIAILGYFAVVDPKAFGHFVGVFPKEQQTTGTEPNHVPVEQVEQVQQQAFAGVSETKTIPETPLFEPKPLEESPDPRVPQKPPSLSIVAPAADAEIVAQGDVTIHLFVANVYPRTMRQHRRPRVCLRIASAYEDTSVGCMQVVADVTEVLLRDVRPGEYTLYASLMSEVKKLSKTERSFIVSPALPVLSGRDARQGQAVPQQQQPVTQTTKTTKTTTQHEQATETSAGETCATTCTRTCTTSFQLE